MTPVCFCRRSFFLYSRTLLRVSGRKRVYSTAKVRLMISVIQPMYWKPRLRIMIVPKYREVPVHAKIVHENAAINQPRVLDTQMSAMVPATCKQGQTDAQLDGQARRTCTYQGVPDSPGKSAYEPAYEQCGEIARIDLA